jgi:nitrate reductase gamma subunit
MYEAESIIAAGSIAWMVIALVVQWIQARGSGRKEYSVKAGSAIKGIIYNFTYAMTPRHKESMRLYPIEFTIGVLMHVGILLAIVRVILMLTYPPIAEIKQVAFVIIFGISILCGFYQFLRRVLSKEMRVMSCFDDYLAIIITIDFLIAAFMHEIGFLSPPIFLIHATVVFIYLPIGKLKHALFFFIARADLGARLGYRGTYPVKRGES